MESWNKRPREVCVCLLCRRKDSGACLVWCPLTLSSVEWSSVIRNSKAISLVPRRRNPRASSELLLNLPWASSWSYTGSNESIAGRTDEHHAQVQSVVRKKQTERRGAAADMFKKKALSFTTKFRYLTSLPPQSCCLRTARILYFAH